jgi:pilus assembly protein Flp/PilA
MNVRDNFLKLQMKLRSLLDESGQDLIEYALVVALIAFAATVGMGTVANGINDSFSKIASRLASAIT